MAKGLHSSWAGWEPRVCCYCGERVTHKHASGHRYGPPPRSWHAGCGPRVVVKVERG
jgi:hypothetical protein